MSEKRRSKAKNEQEQKTAEQIEWERCYHRAKELYTTFLSTKPTLEVEDRVLNDIEKILDVECQSANDTIRKSARFLHVTWPAIIGSSMFYGRKITAGGELDALVRCTESDKKFVLYLEQLVQGK